MPILKVLSRKTSSYKQLANYINKGASEMKPICVGFPHTENPSKVAQYFKAHEYYKSKRQRNKLYHTILSFHSKDNVTEQIMEDMLWKYLDESKLTHSRYLVYAGFHRELEHQHIHIMHSTHDSRSKVFRLSKKELRTIQHELDSYGLEKWGLEHSVAYLSEMKKNKTRGFRVTKVKQKLTDAEVQMKQRGEVSEKENIVRELEIIAKKSRSTAEFEKQFLAHQELDLYTYRGKVHGVKKGAKKYRLKTLFQTRDIDQIFRKLKYQNKILEKTKDKNQQRTR